MDHSRSADSTVARGTYEVLTSPGPAAIAVIRICGPAVVGFLERHVRAGRGFAARRPAVGDVMRGQLTDAAGTVLDDILISVHADAPKWDLRLHLHGSPALVRHCAGLLGECGLVEGGTGVTPLWPGRDALEAEAHALLPRMLTLRGARWLLRQADRLRAELRMVRDLAPLAAAREACRALAAGVRVFDWFARPARVALIGPPNAGKSTLANALADQTVSLVSATPGTTRDWVGVPGQVRGFPVLWLDTAGLRRTADTLEAASVARTRQVMKDADAVVVVLDASAEAATSQARFVRAYGDVEAACVALNKADLPPAAEAASEALPAEWRERAVAVSALEGTGLKQLADRLLQGLGREDQILEQPGAFTDRQVRLLEAGAVADDRPRLWDAIEDCLGASRGA